MSLEIFNSDDVQNSFGERFPWMSPQTTKIALSEQAKIGKGPYDP